MTAVFSEKEKKEAFAIKRRLWTYWFIALGIYVAALATMITINAVSVVVYRDRSVYIPFLVASCALGIASAAVRCFSSPSSSSSLRAIAAC